MRKVQISINMELFGDQAADGRHEKYLCTLMQMMCTRQCVRGSMNL